MMTTNFAVLQRKGRGRRWSDIRAIVVEGAAVLALLGSAEAASAMSAPARPGQTYGLPIVDVLTKCDTRGCFTFGASPRYSRRTMQPSDQTGPRYDRPDAAGPPRFIPRQQTPAKRPQARPLLIDPSLHHQRCLERYRTYDARSDSYIGPGNRPIRCRLP